MLNVLLFRQMFGTGLILIYGISMLSWHVKNLNNLAVLNVIVMGLALVHCAHEGAWHT